MDTIASHMLGLPPWVALLAVFALPALESSAFIGFIFPGEIALILGGVMAYEGRISPVAVLAAGIAGAIVGDSVGYGVGRRFGRRVLDGTLGWFVKSSHLDRAELYLAERGGQAVFFGRFTAALRVMIPGLAGMSGLRYKTFLTYNVASGIIWGTLSVMLGYLGGSSWRHVEQIASHVGLAVLATVAIAFLGGFLVRRTRTAHALRFLPISHSIPTQSESISSDLRRTVVIIATYDEAGNITTVVNRVRAAVPNVDILVVDDSSPDGTAGLVMDHPRFSGNHQSHDQGPARVFLLSRTRKDGLGAAYRAGFAWALTHNYQAVVQMDADLSHPAERIPALLHALDTADVAVGSRYVVGGSVRNWSPRRRLISRSGNLYVRLVLRLPVHDATAGFKAFRRNALEQIGCVESASNGYCFQVENTWRAIRLGLRVTEVPITFTDRTVGTSKMSGSIVAEALTRVLVWRWNELRNRNRTKEHGYVDERHVVA